MIKHIATAMVAALLLISVSIVGDAILCRNDWANDSRVSLIVYRPTEGCRVKVADKWYSGIELDTLRSKVKQYK